MPDDKAEIHSVLSQFVKEVHKPLRNYDLIISEKIKDDKFVPSYDPGKRRDELEDRHDVWDFARRHDKMFDKLSDNIVMSSRNDSRFHGFVTHDDTKHDVPSPRKITAFDEEKLKIYNKELEENPDSWITIMSKVELLREFGRYEEIRGIYDKTIAKDPELLERLGKYEDAIRCYDKIKYDPIDADDDGGVLMRKAYLLHHIGRHEESLKCFDLNVEELTMRACSVTDTCYFSHPLYLKGLFFIKIGKYEDAIECCDEAIREDPWETQLIAVLTTKGDLLAHLGRHEEAIVCYDKILKISQDQDPIFYSLVEEYDKTAVLSRKTSSLYHLGRYDEAMKYYDMTCSRSPPKY